MAPRKNIPPAAQCTAHSRRSPDRCRAWAVPGTTVCYRHGANAGSGGKARAKQLHEERLLAARVEDVIANRMRAAGFTDEMIDLFSSPVMIHPMSPIAAHSEQEKAINMSLRGAAAGLAHTFAEALALRQARPPAPVLPVLDAQEVPFEQVDPDPVLERALPRRLTGRHTATHLGLQREDIPRRDH